MGIPIDPVRLRRELSRRCWSANNLAREARISAATVSAALSGRPIAPRSLRLIALSFERALVAPLAASLAAETGPGKQQESLTQSAAADVEERQL
jgi:hypothetical protein